jgi:hypothetical protein
MSTLTLGSLPSTGTLTTDGTRNLFWNGVQINGGGVGGVTTAQLVSTVTDFQTAFKTQQISTGFVNLSSLNLLDTYTNAENYLTVSTGTLLLNGGFITGSGGSAVSQIIAGTNINILPIGGTGSVTINNSIDPTGLVSTVNLIGLVSTANLENLISTPNLTNLVSTPNLLSLVSTTYLTSQLVSTVAGLSNVAVTQIVAGSNISISPAGGLGAVTINGNAAGLLTIPANLSTSAFFTSSIEASTTRSRILSTGLTTASTVLLYDPLSGNTANNFIVASTFFYFNNFIIGGTRVAQPQWVVF